MEQSRALEAIFASVPDNEWQRRFYLLRSAIRNDDTLLVKSALERKMAFPMVRPSKPKSKPMIHLVEPKFSYQANECLLHIAIECESKDVFDLLVLF